MVATERAEQTMKYLSLLSQQFPNQQSVFTEIINLQAILNLPKGTEHFMSDLHGEYEAFMHILNNCSGVIREHVDDIRRYVVRLRKRATCARSSTIQAKAALGACGETGLPHLVQRESQPPHHRGALPFESLHALQSP